METAKRKTKVIVADDHEMVAGSFAIMIGQIEGFEVAATVVNGLILLQELNRHPDTDLILLDLSMPFKDGFDAVRDIRKHSPKVKIVICSVLWQDSIRQFIEKYDLQGYFPKNVSIADCRTGLIAVQEGKTVIIPPKGQVVPMDSLQENMALQKELLTDREREVIKYLVEGNKNADIATMMKIAVSTVETYRKNIHAKLGTDNGPQLGALVVRLGIC